MSIFSSIASKIFGRGTAAPSPQSPAGSQQTAPGNKVAFNNPTSTAPAPGHISPADSNPLPGQTGAPAATPVDVEAILNNLASKNTQKLEWRHSIVDLLKLLDLDSSLLARQALARELHYSGSMEDSASMNIWLHRQVMQKLADNGGKIPDDLK